MRARYLILVVLITAIAIAGCIKKAPVELKAGDIVFQSLDDPDHKILQEATGSRYTNCGIVMENDSIGFVVYEGVQPLSVTPFDQWKTHGVNQHYVVKRLKDRDNIITPPDIMIKFDVYVNLHVGRDYDPYYEWTDERMYSSEYVWKTFKRMFNVELCKPEKLGDFARSSDAMMKKLAERFDDAIPYNDSAVTPIDIFNSDILYTVDSEN